MHRSPLALLVSLVLAAQFPSATAAHSVLPLPELTGGLVVLITPPKELDLEAFATQRPNCIIHILVRKQTVADTLQKRLTHLRLAGNVSSNVLNGNRIPLIDNVANGIAVYDPDGLPETELMRALAPGGVLLRNQGDEWSTVRKKLPEGTDEWSHFLGDATNNAVSGDLVAGPPRHMQWLAAPLWARNHHKLASISSIVSANGRVFYIVDEAPAGHIQTPGQWFLVARDAFNGALLWKQQMPTWAWHMQGFRSGPVQLPRLMVVDGDRLYAPLALDDPVTVFDARDGQVIARIEQTQGVEEILVHRGTLLALVGTPVSEQARLHPEYSAMRARAGAKRLVAVNTDTFQELWRSEDLADVYPLSLTAVDDRVFYMTETDMICLDLYSGKSRWQTQTSAPAKPKGNQNKKGKKRRNWNQRNIGWSVSTVVATSEILLVANKGKLKALDSASGRQVWQHACPNAGFRSPVDIFVINDAVWIGPAFTEALDIKTGKTKVSTRTMQDIQTAGHHHRCYREKATTQYILGGHRGIEFLDIQGNGHSRNNWLRGVCQYGIFPANGLIYAPSHSCGCYMEAQIRGFWALAAERSDNSAAFTPNQRLIRGPAFGPTVPRPEHEDASWETYRGSSARSCIVNTPTPNLSQLWGTSMGSSLSAPTASDKSIYVARKDCHEVVALETATGRERWRFRAGGRVDSPPTCYRNRVVFGSHDGNVYCLDAASGKLAWRFTAAPDARQTVALDQLESVWPVHGAVLVQDNKIYCAAGRSSYLDGGIRLYCLDPDTGSALSESVMSSGHAGVMKTDGAIQLEKIVQNARDYRTTLSPDRSDGFSMEGLVSDILVGDGNSVFMHHLQFDRDCVRQAKAGAHLFSTSHLLDGSEHHRSHIALGTGNFERLSVAYSWIANSLKGSWKQRLVVPYGLLLAFDDKTVWGVRRRGTAKYSLFRQTRDLEDEGKKLPDFRKSDGKSLPSWDWDINLGIRPRALAKTSDAIVVAGLQLEGLQDPGDAFTERAQGVIAIYSLKDGARIKIDKLNCRPAWNGLAIVPGKIVIVSDDQTIICLGN